LRFSPQYGAKVAVFIDEKYVGQFSNSQVATETSASTVMNSVSIISSRTSMVFHRPITDTSKVV